MWCLAEEPIVVGFPEMLWSMGGPTHTITRQDVGRFRAWSLCNGYLRDWFSSSTAKQAPKQKYVVTSMDIKQELHKFIGKLVQ